jgi:DNA-binding GntR family transcriptional regulator
MAQLVSQPGGATTMSPARMSWREIADDLTDRIRDGEYPPGTALPSYSKLAAIYSVSIATITRALGLVHERGLIEGIQGVGTFVRDSDDPKPPTG